MSLDACKTSWDEEEAIRWVWMIVGVLAVVLGIVWTLQGLNVIGLVVSIPTPVDPLGASGAPTGTVFNVASQAGAFQISQFPLWDYTGGDQPQ